MTTRGPDSSDSAYPAVSRKLILTVSGLMAGAVIAALFIGRTPPPRRETDKREPELNFPKPPSPYLAESDDWFEAPVEAGLAPGLPLPESAPGEPAITEDCPSLGAAPTAAPAVAADTTAAKPSTHAASGAASAPMAPAAPVEYSGPPVGPPLAANGTSLPAPSAPGSVSTTPAIPPAPAVGTATTALAESKPAPPAPSQSASALPSEASRLSPRSGHSSGPATATELAAAPASPSVATPALRKPRKPRPGIAAQSRSLITQAEYTHPSHSPVPTTPTPTAAPTATPTATPTAAPTAAPAAVTATSDNSPAIGQDFPAEVTLPEARAYSARLTDSLRQSGTLSATRSVRLPTKAETTNPRVWRQDDSPAKPQEVRPFGVVVEESDPAACAALASEAPAVPAAQPAHTPEGIPLRTDIPEGTSPLEKSGPDKSLWKRP